MGKRGKIGFKSHRRTRPTPHRRIKPKQNRGPPARRGRPYGIPLFGRITINDRKLQKMLSGGFGTKNYFEEFDAEIIDQDGANSLIQYNLQGSQFHLYVRVKDSTTGHFYFLRVDPDIKTCRDAIAWTFGLSTEEYYPIIET